MTTPRRAQAAPTASAATIEQPWAGAAAAAGVALLAAAAAALEVVPPRRGLAVAIVGVLALLAERGLLRAALAGRLVLAIAIGLGWMAIGYAPFHAFLFPGPPLHAPIQLRSEDPSLPVTVSTSRSAAVDLVLEGELPPNPAGGPPIPVDYTLTFQDAAGAAQVITGRFDDRTRTVRRGRRGTGTVLQPHHQERHVLQNPARGDLYVTAALLEPAAQSGISVTAYRHRLPSNGILAVLGGAFVLAAAALDALLVPASDGLLTLATPAVLGAALVLWTSNTAQASVSSLIGAVILGAPLGLALGALLRMVARRTLASG